MDNIKKVIILLILVIMIIIVSILLILRRSKVSEEIQKNEEIQLNQVFESENKIQKINTKAEYFNVKMCIEKYKSYSRDLFYATQDDNTEYMQNIRNQLPGIIPDFVIQKLNLTNDNIYDEIGISNKYIRIDNIYTSTQTMAREEYIEDTNICAYIVDGNFIDWDTYQKEKFKIIIVMDMNNSTFFIIPQKYIEQENLDLEENSQITIYNKDIIEQNDYNSFVYSKETEEDMCEEYLNRFRLNLTYDLEYAYKCLNNEYKSIRFGSYDKFREYINKNMEQLDQIKLSEYTVGYYENYIEYVCKDQYQNLYIFDESSPMDFSLKLDTYTITTDKFKNAYKNSSDINKVQMNVDKFLQMINRQDYKTSYNCISEGFKNNYFNTQDEFEQFIKQRFFLYSKIKYTNIVQEGSVYICDIEISDFTEESSDVRNMRIVIKLNEETNFEMSFIME